MDKHFNQIKTVLAQAESEILNELEVRREELEKESKKISQQRRAVATRDKNLKQAELDFEKKTKNIDAKYKAIRKSEELEEFNRQINDGLARLEVERKDVAEREGVVKAKLEELEKRELKLNENRRTYKEKIEKDILGKFLK
ncbi:MAG: hypothetical protein K0U38_01525 [Epsilonproteobacteria bacterium]|nr:hypothetical protein [Campylobacterota bacterium]